LVTLPEWSMSRTGVGVPGHTAHRALHGGVGAALASRWPIGVVREVDLHVVSRVDPPWAAAVVVAEVELPPPFGLSVFVHHKPTYQVGYARERELQAVACARFVEGQAASRDLHVVLLGDLDDTPGSSSDLTSTATLAVTGRCV
jgi:endonuclease/exonuclease/phosphatase family metal-dependent hydrolase